MVCDWRGSNLHIREPELPIDTLKNNDLDVLGGTLCVKARIKPPYSDVVCDADRQKYFIENNDLAAYPRPGTTGSEDFRNGR